MGTGRRWSNIELFKLIWPLVVEQLLAMTMGAVALIMVKDIGEFAVAGVNLIENINNLFVIAFISLSTGGAVVVSQYIGRKDHEKANLAAKQLIYSVTIISLVIATIALSFREPVIRFIYGASVADDVMAAAKTFFLFSSLSYPMLALYSSCAALFRSTGNSQIPMRVSILMNVMNIAGCSLFLLVFRMGVAGAALPILLSRTTAALLIFSLLSKKQRYVITLSGIMKIKLVPSMIRRIMNVGVPTGMEQSMFMIGRLLTQRIFPIFGTGVMAANAVSSLINSISFMAGNAVGIALLTIVGQCLGAGDIDAAKKEATKILRISWVMVFIISMTTFILRDPLISIFNLSPDAHATASVFLTIHCFTLIVGWTFSFTLPNALRAAGDARYVMLVAAVSMWTVRVTAAYFFCFTLGLGPKGVWLAMSGDFIVRGTCFYLRWRSGRWQGKKVIE